MWTECTEDYKEIKGRSSRAEDVRRGIISNKWSLVLCCKSVCSVTHALGLISSSFYILVVACWLAVVITWPALVPYRTRFLWNLSQNSLQIFTSSLSSPSSLSLLAFVFLVLIISSIFCSTSHLCFWLLTESVRGGNTECHLSNSFSLLFSLSMKYLYGR